MKDSKLKVTICIIAVILGAIIALNCGILSIKTQTRAADKVLFIDPGHGGIDGGAVSSNGVPEKDINLEISKYVKELAEEYGWQVIMTRETDKSLGENEKGTIRSKKTADLRARCEMMEKYHPTVAVSIHLNSFKEDLSVKGVQVFYPGSWSNKELQSECRAFAEDMQMALSEATDAEKERVPLTRDGVFIFREEICPIVIVECGFLSNYKEAKLLQTDSYQKKIAQGIMAGITEFTGVQKEKKIEIIDSRAKKNKI